MAIPPKSVPAHQDHDRNTRYQQGSLTLTGAVAMGTGVMIGAGIFALTGQVAELAGTWFPVAFLAAALITAFSAYSYVKLANAYPSAGGIAMFLEKAYGRTVMTGACALLMYFSMVINESLVARTFGTYTLQLFDVTEMDWLVPALGLMLLAFAFVVNILGNQFIQTFSFITAFLKVGGIAVFAVAGLWASGLSFESAGLSPQETGPGSFLGAVALAILAYKGFTTITNSGGEIENPHHNVGRAIVIAIGICVVIYLLVTLAVGGNLTIEEIVRARDYALAEAARPAFGDYGLWFTVAFAIVALVLASGGVLAAADRTMHAYHNIWVPFTPEALAEALDRGDVVVLDFTAEWCLNCKSLEAAFLSRAPVKPMLLQAGVVPMVADVTSSGAPGWDKLRELGQTGIPLLAVYGPGTDEPWLANNYTGGTVVEAIERARGTGLAGQVPEPASP